MNENGILDPKAKVRDFWNFSCKKITKIID